MQTAISPVDTPVNAPPALREKLQPSAELMERILEAQESLETLDSVKFPIIRFKDGKFTLNEGEEPVDSFEGVIVYTKQSNVYYKGKYNASQVAQPDCFSPDGKTPTVENPIHPECGTCPLNQYKSARDGEGKACKNTRPLFIIVGDSIIPRQLRAPPTSLRIVENYIMGMTADHSSYSNVVTKFSAFKKDASQGYHNLKLQKAKPADGQEKVDTRAMKDLWLAKMKAMEVQADEEPETSQPQEPEVQGTGRSF